MKRTPKVLLTSILSLAVLYGAILVFSPLRPLGLVAALETKIANLGSKAKASLGLSDSAKEAARTTQTSLATVAQTIHKLIPRAEGWGGALTEVDGSVIVVDKVGKLFQWHGGSRATELAVRVPMEIEPYLSSLTGKPWDHWDTRTHFRVMDALARRTANGYELLVTHNYWHGKQGAKSVRLSVIRFDALSNIGNSQWETLLECQPFMEAAPRPSPFSTNESGGRMAELDAARVMVVFGTQLYGTWNWPYEPLDTGNCYGRAIVIDTTTGHAEPFARGLRNPQGLFIDSGGRVWETEHGPRGGDELNLLEVGSDYGWPHVTYGTAYESAAQFSFGTKAGTHDGYREPVLAWVPGIAISNLIRIEDSPDVWAGDLLIGALKSMSLNRVRIRDGRAVLSETIPLGVRVRDLLQLSDGRIIVWTDGGEIVELAVDELPLLAGSGNSADVSLASSSLSTCATCHSLARGDDSRGPSLHGVIDRQIGATTYAQYSPALLARTGKWSAEDLRQYLRKPGEFMPGTTMPDLNLSETTIDDIIVQLEALKAPN